MRFEPLTASPTLARPLEQLAIELTVYCNLQCKMCSVWELREHGVSFETAKKLLRDARSLGAHTFVPCGAESFMRKDFLDVVEYAHEIGFTTQEIVTNGTMITDAHLERLAAVPSVQLHVSIDGPKHIQDDLRGEGVYDKSVGLVKRALAKGIRTGMSGVILRETLGTLTHLIDLAAELGVHEVSYQPFQTEISGPDKEIPRFALKQSQRDELHRTLDHVRAHAKERNVKLYTEALFPVIPPYLMDGKRPIPDGGCYLPSKFLLVDWRGDIYPCFFMRTDADRLGNANNDAITDLWHGLHHKQLQTLALTERCPGCLAACSDVETFNESTQKHAKPRAPQKPAPATRVVHLPMVTG